MNKSATQFVIAVLFVLVLGAATLLSIVGELWFDKSSQFTMLLVGGLLTGAGQATAYLFRLNGSTGG
jgi:hypothetical protein